MGEIDVEPGTILKSDDEAMGESFRPIFRADVRAPFEINDRVDLVFEGCELLLDGFDLSRFGFLLELEANNMTEGSACFLFCGNCFFVVIGHGENWNKGG